MRNVVYTIAIIAFALIVAFSFRVLLVGFAGLLLAILLRTAADWVHAFTKLSPRLSLTLIVTVLILVLVANIWLFGRSFAGQIDEMRQGINQAREQLYAYSQRYDWSKRLWPQATERGQGAMISGATFVASGTIGIVAGLILMLFISVYVASDPKMYRRGFVRLFPANLRHKAEESIDAICDSLRWWIFGQIIAMSVVGILTTIGLLMLDVPLPFTLGFITAILNFIPNVGAILSAFLAMVLALSHGVESMLYVLILYLVIQAFEAYLLTPMIQHHAVSLPPALTITVQAIMGVLLGGVGLALAAPLTVVGLVLTRQLYLKDDRSGAPRFSRRAAGARLPKASNE